MNTLPCGQCKYFDALKGSKRKPDTGYARCAAKSTYPLVDSPGIIPPPGVKRSTRTHFEIVATRDVVPACVQAEKIK
jgi:hypothetical protein